MQNSSALSDVILSLPFGGVGTASSQCRPSNPHQFSSTQLQFMDQMRPSYNHEVIQNGLNQHAVAPAERHFLQETIGITDRIYDRGGAEEPTYINAPLSAGLRTVAVFNSFSMVNLLPPAYSSLEEQSITDEPLLAAFDEISEVMSPRLLTPMLPNTIGSSPPSYTDALLTDESVEQESQSYQVAPWTPEEIVDMGPLLSHFSVLRIAL